MVRMAQESDMVRTTGCAPEAVPAPGAVPPAAAPAAGSVLADHGDPAEGEVRLPNRPESAGTARRLTEAVLVLRWSLGGPLVEHAVLLVSELVGNAVRHTGAPSFGLRMTRRRGRLRVEVRDPSRGLPCLMPVRETDISGRGLFLVDTLADRWGVDLLPHGKTTWFEMRLPEH
jgi:anti-sigma regulatory factor (Ser/Thr protein kinase)